MAFKFLKRSEDECYNCGLKITGGKKPVYLIAEGKVVNFCRRCFYHGFNMDAHNDL